MPKVAVLTDSTAGVPEALMESLHIKTVAYYLHRGQEVLRDLVTIGRDEFVRWLPSARVAPTTAAPGPGEYLEAYNELVDQGAEDIVSIHMSSKISAAYESRTAARALLLDKHPHVQVEVIDSRNAALCQGWMAIQAARAAAAGSMLHIKPLIGLEDGEIVPLGSTHSRRQAYAAMADMVAAVVGNGQARIGYLHAGALQEAQKVKELVEATVPVVESIIGELTPVLAVHTGPGMAGLCYYRVDD